MERVGDCVARVQGWGEVFWEAREVGGREEASVGKIKERKGWIRGV